MPRKVIVTCSVNGGGDPKFNPNIPITPQRIAEDSIAAARAGAAVAHIHVRDLKTGFGTLDFALYREVVKRIRDSGVDVVINLTTGPGGNFLPDDNDPTKAAAGTSLTTTDKRIGHVEELKPELASISPGSNNKGAPIYINTEKHILDSLKRFRAAGIVPEFEVFDPGYIMLTRDLIKKGLVPPPPIIQLCLGYTWSAPATVETMIYMKSLLPPDCVWFAFGRDLMMFPMMALTVMLGGHVRVGLEDTAWISEGKLAPGNTALVEKAVNLIRTLDGEPATPKEAREMMGLRTSSRA
jgi:3-dehydrocarnitine:acetyl-CoA trimethylamine transferase